MAQGSFQFNDSIINEIMNFVISPFDLFFLWGPKGSSKSETIEKIIPMLEEDNLVFRHFCFENTVIDDFLLNFYDSLRNFTIAGSLSLKKFTTGDFKEKVSHYFRAIEKNCIVIVENFDKTEHNTEITDFLTHLSKYPNVKIIIVSRKANTVFTNIEFQSYHLEEISKEDFKYKLSVLSQINDNDIKEKFYQITKGFELYLNMSIKFCTNTGITIPDLINEFERKNYSFEHFIVSKFITLAPHSYREFFNILSAISHPVSIEFIENYNLGKTDYIDYLSKNFLISKFNKEIYVKDYFKEYIKEDFTVQDKQNYYKKLAKIYETELTKSPKDRLLRLSRESMRKEIERLKSLIPTVNTKTKQNVSYIGISGFSTTRNVTDEKQTLKDKFNKIKEIKNRVLDENYNEPEAEQPQEKKSVIEPQENKIFIIELINEARKLSSNFSYKDANEKLFKAMKHDLNDEFEIELCNLIAKNYEALNEFQLAQSYYEKAKARAVTEDDSRECEIYCSIASLNKKMYKIDTAYEQFKDIALNRTYSDKYRAIASIELGEIKEAKGEIKGAANFYQDALSLSLGNNKQLTSKSYYKLALLYDEAGDIENAVKYYKKNYTLSAEPYENKYYSISLTNLASIYTEQAKYREAIEFLKLALTYDSENNDLENMYYSQKELAKLYLNTEPNNAIGFYAQALDSANKLHDTFKIALIYFEIGEYYYDRGEEEQALRNFYNSRKVLGNNLKDENVVRINSRIQDIKMRLNEVTFNLIAEKFEHD